MNTELYIILENNKYYIDTEKFNTEGDILLEQGDVFKFEYEGKKYVAKILDQTNKEGLSELLLLK